MTIRSLLLNCALALAVFLSLSPGKSRAQSAGLYESPLTFSQIEFKGYLLETLRGGTGTPQIVFLHGLPDASANQIRLLSPLAENHAVFAYDRLGLGKSEKPHYLSYTIEDQAKRMHEIFTQFQINQHPFILIGHSVGGTLALEYARNFPDELAGLVLMNTVVYFESGHTGLKDWSTWLLQQPALGEFLMLFYSKAFTKNVLRFMFYDDTKISDSIIESYHRPMTQKGTKKHFLGTLRSLYDRGSEPQLEALEEVSRSPFPKLVIWTEEDSKMPVEDGQAIAKLLKSDFFRIADCGHLPQLELSDYRLKADLIIPLQHWLTTNGL